jgi:transposase, IS6 family
VRFCRSITFHRKQFDQPEDADKHHLIRDDSCRITFPRLYYPFFRGQSRIRGLETGRFQTHNFSSGGGVPPEKRHHFLLITFRINGKMTICINLLRKQTCMYGGEKNCLRVCLFHSFNKAVLRKVSVEIRKINSSNNMLCVRWYLRYALSYRDLQEMMRERGLSVDHTTIFRWVQHYAPEIDKHSRPHLKACNASWRVDETYVKIKNTWMYLYRAVDSAGNTLEFLLSPTRDAEAAKRFFVKALHSRAGSAPWARPVKEPVAEPMADPNTTISVPRVINVDKHAAYPKAIAELKAAGMLPEQVELRPFKYLNNLIEQDHRFIKRLVKPGMGFFSFESAWRTLQGYEVMHMIRKGQMRGVEKEDILGQIAFIASLFGVAV